MSGMDERTVDRMRELVDQLVEQHHQRKLSESMRYWYPLSLPTYGTDEILEALDAMCSFRTSMSDKTQSFERLFAQYQGCADAVMVNSGSSADLLLALLLTNPRGALAEPGDEVIVPVVTWPTQIWSIMMAGLNVKLVDVDPQTLNVDIDDLEDSISDRTRAVFLVHLIGNPCDMDRIGEIARRHNLHIIEDCCEAMGATWRGIKVGNFGIGAAFSFFFSHHITTMEGGMVTAKDVSVAEQLRIFRAHGWVRNVNPKRYELERYREIDERYAFVNWGLNVRPTELQAGFGLHQIQRAAEFSSKRAQFAARIKAFLTHRTNFIWMPRVESHAAPSWLAIPLMVDPAAPFSRNDITCYLEEEGVETRPVVAGNLARQPAADHFPEFQRRTFPGADEVHRRGFYIGLSPMQNGSTIDRLIETFERFIARF